MKYKSVLMLAASLLLCVLNVSAGEREDLSATDLSVAPIVSSPSVADSIARAKRAAELVAADSIAANREQNRWLNRLKQGTLDLKDSTVIYPRFMKFCINVYNWGDKFFNGTDPEYIGGTGKRWKVFLKSDNWCDSYSMNLGHNMPIRMMSDIYCNAGAYLQYMAVSVGYQLDMSNIIGNKPQNHKKFEFSFSCARFSIEAYFNENTGGSYLRTFGKYNKGHLFKKAFPGVSITSLGMGSQADGVLFLF